MRDSPVFLKRAPAAVFRSLKRLAIFDVPLAALPRVVASIGPFPKARGLAPLPVGAALADSHSALFAHGAFAPGPVKATYGTGSSLVGLVDPAAVHDGNAGAPGVCLTLACQLDSPTRAYEGNIRSAGSTLVWAAELVRITTKELADLAADAPDSRGVYLVPAFGGLAAPGGTRTRRRQGFPSALHARRSHALRSTRSPTKSPMSLTPFARAAPVERLLVDGGPTRNDQLMQFEADMVGVSVERTSVAELSAMGVAHLAGLTAGRFTLAGDRGSQGFMPGAPSAALRAKERRARGQAVAGARSGAIGSPDS